VGGKLERHATWDACNRRVKGVPNARYRKASSPSEEAEILRSWGFQGD
jgi:ribonuclease HI